MAASIQSAIAKLKHKDIRQRRRAVRMLFDADAHESVEAFSPFLEDQDVWFRNKAIEAYRRWAPMHAPHLLEQLAERGGIDGQRCVASVLETIQDVLRTAHLSRLLLNCEDVVVVRRAVRQLITINEVTTEELNQFQNSDDYAIRTYAATGNSDANTLLGMLKDEHPDVRRQAATSLLALDLESDQDQKLQDALEHDDALWKLAIPIALQQSRPTFVDLMTSKGMVQQRFLIQTLKETVVEADDPRLRMLMDGDGISLVARWLVGRNDEKSDVLRHELLFDERVDSIDKSRLLERLLHRQNEPVIQELATKLIENSTDELILSAAQNLYTSSTNSDS